MQKFHTKTDWWVIAFAVCMTGLLGELLMTMQAKGNIVAYPLHSAVYFLTIILMWWLLLGTRYVVDQGVLTIHCLFLTWRIQLINIQHVSASNNSVMSPALSFDRVKIDYIQDGKAKFILLSPRKKQAFIQALQP